MAISAIFVPVATLVFATLVVSTLVVSTLIVALLVLPGLLVAVPAILPVVLLATVA
jgi:hypothetical protein